MADLEERAPRPLILIAGMLNTKDPVGFFQPFAGLVRRVYTVPVPVSAAARDPAELAVDRGRRRPADRGLRQRRRRRSTPIAAEVNAMAAAAHPDLRLALPRRVGARRERHAAGIGGDLRPVAAYMSMKRDFFDMFA